MQIFTKPQQRNLTREGAPELSSHIKTDLDKSIQNVDPDEKGLAISTTIVVAGLRVIMRALKRFANGRDHGLYTTVVEEVVERIKGDIISGEYVETYDTQDAFEGSEDFAGGNALLDEINKLWKKGKHPRLILIGHSAGSVFICNLLINAAKVLPDDIKFEVVFLAPACSFGLFKITYRYCRRSN